MDEIFKQFSEEEKKLLLDGVMKRKFALNSSFVFYNLVMSSINDVFGKKKAKLTQSKITTLMKEKLNLDSDITIVEILSEIQKNEILEFLKNLKGHEHIIYFWGSKIPRKELMERFFSFGTSPKGFISSEPEVINNVGNMTYSQILRKENPVAVEFGMIVEMDSKNKQHSPTRVGGDDCTQWFDQGLKKEFLDLEKDLDGYFSQNNISCICGYNRMEITDENLLEDLLSRHGYVILDDPFEIYKKVV